MAVYSLKKERTYLRPDIGAAAEIQSLVKTVNKHILHLAYTLVADTYYLQYAVKQGGQLGSIII